MKWNMLTKASLGVVLGMCVFALSVAFFGLFNQASATGTLSSNEHLITIHDRGSERSVISKENTLRKVFAEIGLVLDQNDIVEPGIDEELVSQSYQVNIYRARPVTIIDGDHRVRVMSAYQTPKQIAHQAGVMLHDEDKTTLGLPEDIITSGASLQMTIDRATPMWLILYGKKERVYTQATTVAEFLKEKKITLGPKDDMNRATTARISENMKLEIWRNGIQTQTREEKIAFGVRQVQDADRPVGYKKVTTVGIPGKKVVTYRVIIKNGKIVKRKALHVVVLKKAVQQVEIVGAKPSFSGDFAAALAKLRACEGGYSSWNPAGPYYGAYQFDEGTWNSVSDAPYGSATPAEQDAAARELYLRRGWSPWPVCGASLPDTYR